mmetsp:Transcript_7894/g.16690  ORF Transcript_7894/g.16690 Transcript_7894/m.16690 type:complete len:290 (-) Transcript_7894:424-1293(-)
MPRQLVNNLTQSVWVGGFQCLPLLMTGEVPLTQLSNGNPQRHQESIVQEGIQQGSNSTGGQTAVLLITAAIPTQPVPEHPLPDQFQELVPVYSQVASPRSQVAQAAAPHASAHGQYAPQVIKHHGRHQSQQVQGRSQGYPPVPAGQNRMIVAIVGLAALKQQHHTDVSGHKALHGIHKEHGAAHEGPRQSRQAVVSEVVEDIAIGVLHVPQVSNGAVGCREDAARHQGSGRNARPSFLCGAFEGTGNDEGAVLTHKGKAQDSQAYEKGVRAEGAAPHHLLEPPGLLNRL